MLKGIAASHHKTVGQVILRWNVQRGVVIIPKSTHEERIRENFDIWDFELNGEEMKQIASLDMGYSGSRAKHFEPDFVRMCLKSTDKNNHIGTAGIIRAVLYSLNRVSEVKNISVLLCTVLITTCIEMKEETLPGSEKTHA